ncbi:MAG: TIGR03943 family protein [Deltaproteobacteria bacterium]|nr:TIGR03943 family protein [Deltaproteobacteria bacterium]
MNSNVTKLFSLIAVCLPAVVYISWINAYYWLLEGKKYAAFMQPRLWPLLVFAMLLLIVFVAAFISQFSSKRHVPAGSEVWIRTAILLLPLLFLWTIYGQSLGTHAYLNKTLPFADTAAVPDFLSSDSKEGSAVENELTLLRLLKQPEMFDGEQVVIEGIVYRDPRLTENAFRLFRFAVICCAADALPLTIRVKGGKLDNLSNDTWVRVYGRFKMEMVGGRQIPSIAANTVRQIPMPPPEKRYLFF